MTETLGQVAYAIRERAQAHQDAQELKRECLGLLKTQTKAHSGTFRTIGQMLEVISNGSGFHTGGLDPSENFPKRSLTFPLSFDGQKIDAKISTNSDNPKIASIIVKIVGYPEFLRITSSAIPQILSAGSPHNLLREATTQDISIYCEMVTRIKGEAPHQPA